MSKYTVVLDPGHGRNENQSPVRPEYYESNAMYNLAHLVKAELEKYPEIEVILTKSELKENPPVYDRGKFAAEQEADLFISLHSNAFKNPEATGVIAFRSLTNPGIEPFAEKLTDAVSEIMGNYSRPVSTRHLNGDPDRDYYGVIRGAVENGCRNALIIEHGFHTNPADVDLLLKHSILVKIAEAESKLIAEYFGVEAEPEDGEIKPGDLVEIKKGAKYSNGKKIPESIQSQRWYVESISPTGIAIIDENEDKTMHINSGVNVYYLIPVDEIPEPKPEPVPEPKPKPIPQEQYQIVIILKSPTSAAVIENVKMRLQAAGFDNYKILFEA